MTQAQLDEQQGRHIVEQFVSQYVEPAGQAVERLVLWYLDNILPATVYLLIPIAFGVLVYWLSRSHK